MNPRTSLSRHAFPPILFIVIAAVLFSTGGLFIKLTDLSALEISGGRSIIAAATVALLAGRAAFRLNPITLLAAIVYAALLLLFVVANKWTTAANAIFLQFTAPVYVLVCEPLFFKERFRPRDLLTVFACIAGMSLFFIDTGASRDWTGNLAALASGVFFAGFMLLMRDERANRAASVVYGNLLLALVAFIAILFTGASFWGISDSLVVLYLGAVQIGIAYWFFTKGFERGVRSLEAGIVGYIEPVLNPLWVFVFVGERPGVWALVGGAIIISAIAMHALLDAKWKRRDTAAATFSTVPD